MSDEIARLLAHPLRQRLLFEYERTSSPSKVARRLEEPVNVVSYHTQVLRRHGWIELVRTERRRGATESYWRTREGAKLEDETWERISRPLRHAIVLGTLTATRDDARLAALDGGFDGPRSHLSRSVIELDETGVDEAASLLRDVVVRLGQIEAASRARAGEPGEWHELVIQFFRPAG